MEAGQQPGALGYVFGCHVFHEPTWADSVEEAADSGEPLLVTPTFAKAARTFARGIQTGWDARAGRHVALPELNGPLRWPRLEGMKREELDGLRGIFTGTAPPQP